MKQYLSSLLFVLSVATITSCHSPKEAVKTENNQAMTVTGVVKEVQPGKDGYTAQLVTAAGKTYFATISHSNLKDHTQYRAVKTGDTITVKGDAWQMEQEQHITVRELR